MGEALTRRSGADRDDHPGARLSPQALDAAADSPLTDQDEIGRINATNHSNGFFGLAAGRVDAFASPLSRIGEFCFIMARALSKSIARKRLFR